MADNDPQIRQKISPRADAMRADFRRDVLAGLSQRPRVVPARWLYDETGSTLFEQITRLDEYYPTRAEISILRARAKEVARALPHGAALVEFGSGSSAKTPLLLKAIEPAAYVPIDISGEFLRRSARALAQKFPEIEVHPLEGDFTRPLDLPGAVKPLEKIGFFPGSTIGNLEPPGASALLRAMRAVLGEGGWLVIGFDLVKDRRRLLHAYDDARGVTARFNLNLLARINRELGGTIPIDAFEHHVRWNDSFARVEMHLRARRAVSFAVAGEKFAMREGETIHTENSHKFNRRSADWLLISGGFEPLRHWYDDKRQFALVLARVRREAMTP